MGFKRGIYKCDCCGHMIYAFDQFTAPRGLALRGISLNNNAGEYDFPSGEVVELLARKYTKMEGVRISFIVKEAPMPPKIICEAVLKDA